MTTDITATVMTMLAALAVLLGGLWAVLYAVRRLSSRRGGPSHGRTLKVLGSTYVGVKKTVTMVAVPDAVLVLGVTSDGISLLRTIDDPELVDRLTERGQGGGPMSFAGQLKELTGKGDGPS